MVKKDIDLFENPKYFAIFFLINRISAKDYKVRYKHLKYVLVKNHGDTDKKLMKGIRRIIKFEEFDREKSKSLNESVKLNVLKTTKECYDDKIEKIKNSKDYYEFFINSYEGDLKDFRFNSKSSLSNTLNLLIKDKKIIEKRSDTKGNYYCISDLGANLFYRYYCKWIVEYIPDNLIKEAHEKLKEIEAKIV